MQKPFLKNTVQHTQKCHRLIGWESNQPKESLPQCGRLKEVSGKPVGNTPWVELCADYEQLTRAIPSRFSRHFRQRLQRRRIHGERDRVDGKRANARDGQPTPEYTPAARPIAAAGTVPRARVLGPGEVVDLEATLDDVDGNVDHPRDHAGQPARQQHRAHAALAGALRRHAITHELVAGDVDGEAGDLAHHGGVEAGEAAVDTVGAVDVTDAVDGARVADRNAGDRRGHTCSGRDVYFNTRT